MSRATKIYLPLVIFLQFGMTFVFNLLRLYKNKTSLLDLGYFYQILTNFRETGIPTSTINYPFQPMNFMGFHFSPILLLLAPLTIFGPWVLLFVQSVFVSLSAIPIFLCCSKILKNHNLAVIWTAAFLFNPFIMNGAVFDLHEQCIALFFFCWALYFAYTKDFIKLCVMCFILLLFKEHYGIAVAGFGVLWWRLYKDKRGLILAALGLAAFILIVFIIMPSLGHGSHPMFGSNQHLARYSWISQHRWGIFLKLLFSTKAYMLPGYTLILLGIFLFLPLGRIIWLLPAGADYIVNILSELSMPRTIDSYHSTTIIPCLVIAACITLNEVIPKFRYKTLAISLIVLYVNLVPNYFTGLLAAENKNAWNIDTRHIKAADFVKSPEIDEINALVEPQAPISVQSNIGAWFSGRRAIYGFPDRYLDMDYVIIDLNPPFDKGATPFGIPYETDVYEKALADISQNSSFALIYDKNNWLVYKGVH